METLPQRGKKTRDIVTKELGLKKVNVLIRQDLDNDEKKLEVLLVSNFGRTRNNPTKQLAVIKELEELWGIKKGRPENCRSGRQLKKTQKDIANVLGISETRLKVKDTG